MEWLRGVALKAGKANLPKNIDARCVARICGDAITAAGGSPLDFTPEPETKPFMRKCNIAGAMRHNRKEAEKIREGEFYRLYDHYRQAFWAPEEKGYTYRAGAGLFDATTAREIITGSGAFEQERYFTVEPVGA